MGMEQETLIYVEENDKKEAGILTNGLLNKDIKGRAYINALGAELGLKYLALENISTDKTYNLHNVHKLLEEFDISDIMLSNIHIDVRVVFDENQIFIPKSHFEYEIVPDIYLVFLLAEDSSHVKFLGFFEPQLINKNNQNADYYFIEKEKLTAPINLKAFIENFKGNRTQSLSEDINNMAETLMVSVVDQNASKEEMKELLKYLSKSSMLRDRFIEFENFEILSYKAERSPDVTVPEEIAQKNIIDATIDDIAPAPQEVEEKQITEDKDISLPEAPVGDILSDTMNAAIGTGEALAIEGAETLAAGLAEGVAAADSILDLPNMSAEVQDMELSEGLAKNPEAALNGINGDDVTDMFTNESMFSAVDAIDETVNSEAKSEIPLMDNSQVNASNEILENETVNTVEAPVEEASHSFEVGNPDDFFADMDFGDSDNSDTSDVEVLDNSLDSQDMGMQNSLSEGAINFDSINQSPITFEDSGSSQDEMEVLDISNVNAVPNDLDKNISETIEFNNIELSKEEPCYNELNAEETVPVLSMNDFTPLEPLPMEEVKAESYDMDSISLTDNMAPMPKISKDSPTLEPLELSELDAMTPPPVAKKEPEPENDIDEGELSAELDAIPDFDSMGMDMDMGMDSAEVTLSDGTTGSEQIPSEISENKNTPSAEDIQNLTEADIVEQVVDGSEDEVPVTDFEALTKPDESASVNADSSEIPSIDDFSESDIPEDISQLPEEGPVEEAIVESENIVEKESPQDVNSESSDLGTLFDENHNDDVEIESFDSLNNDLNKIPSIYQHTQKLPVKMIAVAAVAAVLVVGSFIGFSMKNKGASSDAEPLAQEVPEEALPPAPAVSEGSDNTDILANTPEVQTLPAAQKEPVNVKKESNIAKAASQSKPTTPASAVTGVTKLSWEVPDYLSYSDNIKKYLQTAGKSIKLSLSSDLLLVTEYAYSNQMKIDLQLSNDGVLKDSKIIKSSGSTQIDNIVLQTVKDTLNVIKPATGEVPTPDFRLALIINF